MILDYYIFLVHITYLLLIYYLFIILIIHTIITHSWDAIWL